MEDARDPIRKKIDGFDVVVRIVHDDDPDLSHLGVFSNGRDKHIHYPAYDRATEKVIKNAAEMEEAREDDTVSWDPREYRFVCYGAGDPNYIVQGAQRLLEYGKSWHCVGIIATASKKGVELGRSMGVWGIESDSDESYFMEMADEQAADAVDVAKEKLAELVAGGEES